MPHGRKKTKTHKGHRRHHRVRGVKIHPKLAQAGAFLAGAALGAGAAAFLNQAVKTALPNQPLWVGGAAAVVAAGVLVMTTEQSPFVMGAEAGMAGMGAVFAANETFINLPGISGVPSGPGYLQNTVNGYKGIPERMVGTFSGNESHVVNGLYSN